jgi:Gpi18-like mannosyltransferase
MIYNILMIKNLLLKCKVPILLFTSSRVLILISILVTGVFVTGEYGPSMNQWDSINYISIAHNGYQFSGVYEQGGELIAFFPMWPMLINFVHHVTYLGYVHTGIILAFIFGLASSMLLYKLVLDWKGEKVASWSTALLAFYPSSIFLSAAYTESLFLFLTLLTFYLLQKNKERWALVAVALACVTRVTGSILGLVYAWEVWKKSRNIFYLALLSMVAVMPFLAFVYFQYYFYGTPLAFMEAQHAHWHQHAVFPWQGLWYAIERAIYDMKYPVMWKIDLVYLVTIIVTACLSFKTVPRYIWTFGLGVLLLTLTSSLIVGMGRYFILFLPLYFYWGDVLARRRLMSWAIIIVLGAAMLATSILFSLGMNVL